MNIKKGTVVISAAGRDCGYYLAVLCEKDGRVLLVDGAERPLEKPKMKNPKHIKPTGTVLPEDAFRGNRALKKALAAVARAKAR